jgi:hypothetical protein
MVWRNSRNGYTEYRYGPRRVKPVSLPKIFMGKRRSALVDKVMDHLDDWRWTEFENEGRTVAGIRSALCLKGFPWSQSHEEAASLVLEAFRRMGAARPSWDEGQPEYLIPAENCKYCGEAFSEEELAGLRRPLYCSIACARAALTYRYQHLIKSEHRGAIRAYQLIHLETLPEKTCNYCRKTFRSRDKDAAHCSAACANVDRQVVPERRCEGCGKIFRPADSARNAKFCDQQCYHAHMSARPLLKTCVECGKEYQAKTSRSMYCCPAHQLRASKRRLAGQVRDASAAFVKQCLECGADFETTVTWSQYCCPAHQRRAYKRRLGGKTNDNVVYLTAEIFDSWFGIAA